MRLAPILFLPALTLVACSSPVPATPDAAWVMGIVGGASCSLGDSNVTFGDSEITPSDILTRVTDQENVKSSGATASVTCAVIPSGSAFEVQVATNIGADALQVNIPSISTGATATAPAMGTVTYESSGTVNTYSGSCNFFFAAPQEGVDAGKFWAAFTCDALTYASNPPSTCASGSMVMPNLIAVESCGTSPIF